MYVGRMTQARWRDDEGVATWSVFLRAHARVVHQVEAELARRSDLPLGWYDVLLELCSAPGGRLRMQDLGEVAILSRTRVSRIVDELEQRDLVRREVDDRDRRCFHATVTPAGRSAFRRAAPAYLRAVSDAFAARLTSAQLTVVRQAMEALLAEDGG